MTLNEVASQLYDLTGGRVNGEHFTRAELKNVIYSWTRPECGSKYICIVTLPGGDWNCKLTRGAYGYDYELPETREHDQALFNELVAGI